MPKPVVLSWSSGKDSAWMAARLAAAPDWEPAALLTTVRETPDGRAVAMHETPFELVEAQAASLGLELVAVPLPWPCPNAIYEARLAEAAAALTAEGVAHVAYGDLFLEDIRRYREALTERLGLEPVFPLWGEDTDALARAMIDGGLAATLVTVDLARLPPDFAGRDFDAELLADLPPGADACGENGEFHTFVTAGPGFSRPIPIAREPVAIRDGYAYCRVRPAPP
jgi:uncharacterized protein (TIGR00290 family)